MSESSPISAPLVRVRPRQRPEWRLDQIAAFLDADPVGSETHVTGISLNTARLSPGDLYAALPGSRTHGAGFITEAQRGGAQAVLTDPAGARLAGDRLPTIVHRDPGAAMPALSAEFYDHPSRALTTVGITGTQGKTTASYMAESAIGPQDSAVIGTTGTRIHGMGAESQLTTPESPALHALFAVMREESVGTCVMEVSSHALVQRRVDEVDFDIAVFLNLGRDHLDYHGTMEEYFLAKARLFEYARRAVINLDDGYGRRLAATTSLPAATFSARDSSADWFASDIRAGRTGTQLTVRGPDGYARSVEIGMPGLFNVSNALAVFAALYETGHDPEAVAAGLARARAVPGRLEPIERDQAFSAFVDYAHKPDAVTAVLTALRPVTDGRLIIVLGAGGDRDPGKRPLMAQAAVQHADLLIVTDDNPRHEDPARIRADIIDGAGSAHGSDQCRVVEVPERADAIGYAVAGAAAGDTIVVAGKGHETGQQIGDDVQPFDDRRVLAAAIEEHQ